MARRARFAVAAVVVLVLTTGVAAHPAENGGGRIVFASSLPVHPPPANLNVTRLGSVLASGQGRVALNGAEGTPFSYWAVSPDGGRIAFVPRESQGTVWIVKADGTNKRRLLTLDAREEMSDLDWSPNGRRLAVEYISYAGCGSGSTKCADWLITILDVATGRSVDGFGEARNFEWSPDGTSYAYESGLFALMPEAATVAGIGREPPGGPWCVGWWSNDSHWLFMWGGADNSSEPCSGPFVAVRVRDGRLLHIADEPPSMSLDGRRIAMQYGKSLRILDGNGRMLRRVAATFHGWLGRGTTMVAVKGSQIRVLDRDGRVLRSVLGSSPSVTRSETRFAALRGSTVSIYDPRGRRLRTLRVPQGLTALGQWSPDGKRLEVRRGSAVGVLTVATSAVAWILDEAPGSNVVTWWGRTGRVAYSSTLVAEPDGCRALWTMDGAGSDVRRVTRRAAYYDEPAWSRDGAWVLATRRPCKWSYYVFEPRPAIVKIRPDGSGERVILTNGRDPVWSPDGTRIAFWRVDPDGRSSVFVATAEGKGVRRIATGSEPAWLPDGRAIAFNGPEGGVFTVGPDGRGLRPLLPRGYGAAWSPDGRRVAYNAGGIVVADADGSNGREVAAAGALRRRSLTWSADGTLLAFGTYRHDESDVGEVYVVPVAGGTPKSLTPWPAVSTQPDWSP